ncbi:dipeptidyl aminopeptidase/acylaminoacyl peptidase [Aliidiomarina maris]|uniref:Dipeptidyl aminopeptidase/acylaminoacyl peptidase n=2 Tax=Aliidiomarina maris TaxID=531312 RepID=A0A327X2N3_9GAMM|nr:dipeptidyl aminopeptidase/acylaminoacyl peptidase [Aliidiomarina maris]
MQSMKSQHKLAFLFVLLPTYQRFIMKLAATLILAGAMGAWATQVAAQDVKPLAYDDVFALELAADPQVHQNGNSVVFVRRSMDRQTDRVVGRLWQVNTDGTQLRPLTQGGANESSPRWSPNYSRIAFISNASGSPQIHMRWQDTGHSAQISNLNHAPSNLSWSPDGEWLAFTMFEPKPRSAPVQLPGKPAGAEWAEAPVYIDSVQYRQDGAGFLPQGHSHVFVLPAEGGTPRQLTSGEFNVRSELSWAPDGSALYFSANMAKDPIASPVNSGIYRLDIDSQQLTKLTDRDGPDAQPKVSPSGRQIAFLGYDDRRLAHQANRLYVMDADGSNVRNLTEDLDRAVDDFAWTADGRGIYFSYDNEGQGYLALHSMRGVTETLTGGLGGLSYSRPYTGGQFSVASNGDVVFTQMAANRPAELALLRGSQVRPITQLNRDFLASHTIGEVEEFWYDSSVDDERIQGWIIYPPGFDENKTYPLILEIHGGPHTAYGPVFAMELQLMAAQGYVVLYTNPRGSTSYGEDFANLIHHNYPSHDFNDLMDGVDAVVERGFINEDELFVMGGSGGGVLTSWSIAHTNRFAAAMVVNPVINWYSFVLTADMYPYFSQYWFPGMPWDNLEHYMQHSPIHHVGKVETPVLLFTGDADYRTPMSETEQYYQALKLRGIETAMVRVPGASHALHARPSNLMAKPAYAVYWFERFRQQQDSE